MNLLKKIFGRSAKKQGEQPVEKAIEKGFKKKISDDIFLLLKADKFKKTGANFSLSRNDLIYFIQIQSSQESTATICKLTFNIGIVSVKLCELIGVDNPNYLDSHWRKRIGYYLDEPTDKWWTIDTKEASERASNEILSILGERVLPEIYTFTNTADLENFWLQGNFQGLTRKQQEEYLKLLGH